MKRTMVLVSGLALVLALVPASWAGQSKDGKKAAGAPETVVYDATSAFEFLKTLAGDWDRGSGDHEHGSSSRSANFKVTAAGSTVVETLYAGEPTEMVSVFHMDGKQLLLTHYCALKNAPIMKFEKSDKPGEIKFAFYGGTNFDPKVDTHVHQGVFQIKDKNTVEATFVAFANGKPRPEGRAILKRKTSE
ncbi:MAG TPA: hypothetical protein VNS63_10610, partial [Blastocatellia bacterium]|nr:hypothetical protein [Blastocatellia bacterium]